MAVPKRRSTQTRGRKRRTHWKLKPPTLSRCGNCGERKPPHVVCTVCGYYKGNEILEIEEI